MYKQAWKYLAVIAAGVLIGSGVNYARAAPTGYRSGYEIQLINRGTPLADAPTSTEYLDLTGVTKVRLSVCTCTSDTCATRGGNLTGGTMQCWYRSDKFGWIINLDLALSVGSPAQPCRTWSDMWSPASNIGGAMFCAASSVTVASGTHLEAHLEGITQ